MRKSLVAGNWKMHGSEAGISQLLTGVTEGIAVTPAETVVCPTFLHIAQAVALCAASPVAVGAQDCSHAEAGAYTGEVAAVMLKEAGCQWAILGHSERRQYHGETDALVAAKLQAAVAAGLQVMLCVGETLEQREGGGAEAVVAQQLRGALNDQPDVTGLVVAYEPVWAIGTGLTASPEQAQAMHAFIRTELASIGGVDADATRILYGGSVKSSNAADLFAQADIDGALVGGASLDADEFLAIVAAAS